MNGLAVFEHTPNGWRLMRFTSLDSLKFGRAIENHLGRLVVKGDFKQMPKNGVFCKRPHKLIWG
jgi:hypothetical protein